MISVGSGTLPDWLAGIGTVGTLFFTLVLLLREIRSRRSGQARLVAAWVKEAEDPSRPSPVLSVIVRNGSTEPVYHVWVAWYDDVAHDERGGKPGDRIFQMKCLPPLTELPSEGKVPARMGHLPLLTIEFTDASGRRWRREGGALSPRRRVGR